MSCQSSAWVFVAGLVTLNHSAPPPPHLRSLCSVHTCTPRSYCCYFALMSMFSVLGSIRAKGIVPLPGVKTKAHADEIVGCLGWQLVQEDVDILDAAHDVRDFVHQLHLLRGLSNQFEWLACSDFICPFPRRDVLTSTDHQRARGSSPLVGLDAGSKPIAPTQLVHTRRNWASLHISHERPIPNSLSYCLSTGVQGRYRGENNKARQRSGLDEA